MNELLTHKLDPSLDLVLERTVDIPKELVWKAWTTPEQLKQWFTPAPWETAEIEVDLRPGGIFRTLMRSPDGAEFDGVACYLEVIENEKLVWTSALLPGYRPKVQSDQPGAGFVFTAVISIEDFQGGTKYTAIVIHPDEESKKQHEDMGFHSGWSSAFDQLVAMVKSMEPVK